MHRRIRAWVWMVLAAFMMTSSSVLAAQIAQRHPYQKTLRDYFATLTEADFTVELKPVTYDNAYFANIDTVARYWMLFLESRAEIPSNEGIRVLPRHFTLAAMEAGSGVNVSSGRGAFMDPKDVAWWTQWDYPGNPYLDSKPLKLRAFVIAAVDMIMQDEDHDNGGNLRSDFLGGSMIRYAYTYRMTRDAVPENVRNAYAEGLVRMFEKLEKMAPHGSGGSDMEFFQLSGMWYAADALGGDFMARALARAHVVIDAITSKTGYEKHGGAFDASYQGIALRFLTWGAMLYQDPKVTGALHKMLVLKSHLSLPEPDGVLHGPTHFNTGTAADAPNDQWAWVSRDFAMAMVDELALYTIWSRVGLPDEEKLRAAVKAGIGQLDGMTPSEAVPGPWSEVHWTSTLNFAYDLYRPGFYAKLAGLAKADSPLTKPLYSGNENFIHDLNGGGEFLAARFDDYAVVVHSGALASHWASGVSGKSGGGISAFWTPQAGSAILGRCRATQSAAPDELTDANKRGPCTWAVHAITGRGANGNYFSSARILNVASKYEIKGKKRAVVSITGNLGSSATADPQDELKGTNILYTRELRIEASGVTVTSSLATNPGDRLQELWETIPVHFGPVETVEKAANTRIDLRVGGEWTPATQELAKADRIRITRYGKPVYIVLEKPRRIKTAGPFESGAHGGIGIRVIMIDLTEMQKNPSIRYRITVAP